MITFQVTLSRADGLELLEFCEKHGQKQFAFAKDHGAYFCASPVDGQNVVKYVKGCNPNKDPEYYDTAMCRFGGDDFGEYLPIEWLYLFVSRANCTGIVVRFGARSISAKGKFKGVA